MTKQEIYNFIKDKSLLKTEDDNFDFSSFDSSVSNGGEGITTDSDTTSTTTPETDTNTNNLDTSDLFSNDDNNNDFDDNSFTPTATATYNGGLDSDKDSKDKNNFNNPLNSDVHKYKVIDLIINDDNPDNIKVKLKDLTTNKVKIKNITDINI